MKVIATHSAQHLIGALTTPAIRYTVKQFSDGELYLKLNDNMQDEVVWVLAGTQAPAENMLELFFMLDALTHVGAKSINIFFVYFAYARQTEAELSEARSAQVICNTLKQFSIDDMCVLHAHAANDLHKLLNFKNVIDFDFFCTAAKNVDTIVAPDAGAADFAQEVAKQSNKECIVLTKTRPEHEMVSIENVNGDVAGKKILIVDDMISTGRTLISAAQALKGAGALHVSAAVTHGLCDMQTYQKLATIFDKITVTNSIAQKNIPEVKVWDVGKFITGVIER